MIFLLLTILANVAIFLAFRSFPRFGINTFPAIVTNYLVCVITGTLYTGFGEVSRQLDPAAPWFRFAIMLGIIFVCTFYLMATTTQKHGVAVATVASKMSLAIPVVFSLFVFKIATNSLDTWNYVGIALALVAIFLVSRPAQPELGPSGLSFKTLWLPLGVFIMGGVIDTSLNYASHELISEAIEPIFPIMTFGFAFLAGVLLCLVFKIKFRKKDIVAGVLLGIPNYFSIFLQIKALSAFNNNGALLYPSLNIGIIIGSTVAAILFFKERLARWNWVGVALAVIVIFLLSHQELLKYF